MPLAGVAIDGELSTIGARVSVSQRYVNHESVPIEAVYLFPLDEGAAVCGFEALIDGTLVIGEVKERDDAFKMYDDAMERGDGAFLLDEERPDVFQASIGNLPPGKEVTVKLTYVTELAAAGRALRFVIPTTVAPRYAPAADRTGVGRPDAETLNPPRAFQRAVRPRAHPPAGHERHRDTSRITLSSDRGRHERIDRDGDPLIARRGARSGFRSVGRG